MILVLLWIAIGFVSTEIFSGWLHKYIMHGVLWNIHKTHHSKTKGFFELNDLFIVFFGGMAIILMLLGFSTLDYKFWLGTGISLYGCLYFVLHDILIHKRLNWFGRPKLRYLSAITKAHRAHHKTNTKEDAESFGLFLVPKRFYEEDK